MVHNANSHPPPIYKRTHALDMLSGLHRLGSGRNHIWNFAQVLVEILVPRRIAPTWLRDRPSVKNYN